jgi:hypothetical protein
MPVMVLGVLVVDAFLIVVSTSLACLGGCTGSGATSSPSPRRLHQHISQEHLMISGTISLQLARPLKQYLLVSSKVKWISQAKPRKHHEAHQILLMTWYSLPLLTDLSW